MSDNNRLITVIPLVGWRGVFPCTDADGAPDIYFVDLAGMACYVDEGDTWYAPICADGATFGEIIREPASGDNLIAIFGPGDPQEKREWIARGKLQRDAHAADIAAHHRAVDLWRAARKKMGNAGNDFMLLNVERVKSQTRQKDAARYPPINWNNEKPHDMKLTQEEADEVARLLSLEPERKKAGA